MPISGVMMMMRQLLLRQFYNFPVVIVTLPHTNCLNSNAD